LASLWPKKKKESHKIENPKLRTSSPLEEEENELRHCSQLKSNNQRISDLIKRFISLTGGPITAGGNSPNYYSSSTSI
jgi:hypothetical protein